MKQFQKDGVKKLVKMGVDGKAIVALWERYRDKGSVDHILKDLEDVPRDALIAYVGECIKDQAAKHQLYPSVEARLSSAGPPPARSPPNGNATFTTSHEYLNEEPRLVGSPQDASPNPISEKRRGTSAPAKRECPVAGCSNTYTKTKHLFNHIENKHPLYWQCLSDGTVACKYCPCTGPGQCRAKLPYVEKLVIGHLWDVHMGSTDRNPRESGWYEHSCSSVSSTGQLSSLPGYGYDPVRYASVQTTAPTQAPPDFQYPPNY